LQWAVGIELKGNYPMQFILGKLYLQMYSLLLSHHKNDFPLLEYSELYFLQLEHCP